MSNTPIDNLLRLVGDEHGPLTLEALAQAWQEGYDQTQVEGNPYTPVRYP